WSGYAVSQSHAVTAGTAHDLLVFRIIPTRGGPEFFARRGMPDVEDFKREAAAGVYLGARSPTRNDPRWLAWVRRDWLSSCAAWLAHRPAATLGEAARKLPSLLSGRPRYGSTRTIVPAPVQDLLWSRSHSDILFWIVAEAAFLVFAWTRVRARALD